MKTMRVMSFTLCVVVNILSSAVAAEAGVTTSTLVLPDVPTTASAAGSFRVEEVARDLRTPWSIVFTPDGRLIFSERIGRVRVIENGSLKPEPLLTLQNVYTQGKMGLLGMTLHPNFSENQWLYLAYCYGDKQKQTVRIVRYRDAGDKLVEPQVILDGIPAAPSHAGCRLLFGPDGKLYVTTGDAGTMALSQQLDSLGGKTLRLNDDGGVPEDNPYVGKAGARWEIWSMGHRNAQGIAFQPGSGVQFQSEHGPSGFDGPGGGDEINIVEPGKNYGWPVVHHRVNAEGMESPLMEFTPSIAPGSAMFYSGKAFPQYTGNLFVGCLGGKAILRVVLDGTKPIASEMMLHKEYGRIREVAEGPDGSIYFTTSERDIEVKNPAPETDRIMRLVPAEK